MLFFYIFYDDWRRFFKISGCVNSVFYTGDISGILGDVFMQYRLYENIKGNLEMKKYLGFISQSKRGVCYWVIFTVTDVPSVIRNFQREGIGEEGG